MKSHSLRVRHVLLLRQKNLQTCSNIFKSFFFCSNTGDPAHTGFTPFHHILPDLMAHTYFYLIYFCWFCFILCCFIFRQKKSWLVFYTVHILHMQWGSNVHRMKRGPKTNDSVFIISGLRIYHPDDNNQPLQPAVSFMIFASPRIFLLHMVLKGV